MIAHYYNEWDKGAAAWLRELINNKLIPFGYVDERSIKDYEKFSKFFGRSETDYL